MFKLPPNTPQPRDLTDDEIMLCIKAYLQHETRRSREAFDDIARITCPHGVSMVEDCAACFDDLDPVREVLP